MNGTYIYILFSSFCLDMIIQKMASNESSNTTYDLILMYFKLNFIIYLFAKFIYKQEITSILVMILIMFNKKIYQISKCIFDMIIDLIIINIQWLFLLSLIFYLAFVNQG